MTYIPEKLNSQYEDGGRWGSGGWKIYPAGFKNLSDFPSDEGWKFHIAANKATAQSIAEAFLDDLCGLKLWHKIIGNEGDFDKPQSDRDQRGKFIAVYAFTLMDVRAVLEFVRNRPILERIDNVEPIAGDQIVPNTKIVYARYGAFRATCGNDRVVLGPMDEGADEIWCLKDKQCVCPPWIASFSGDANSREKKIRRFPQRPWARFKPTKGVLQHTKKIILRATISVQQRITIRSGWLLI